jgi:hypothetical protein
MRLFAQHRFDGHRCERLPVDVEIAETGKLGRDMSERPLMPFWRTAPRTLRFAHEIGMQFSTTLAADGPQRKSLLPRQAPGQSQRRECE